MSTTVPSFNVFPITSFRFITLTYKGFLRQYRFRNFRLSYCISVCVLLFQRVLFFLTFTILYLYFVFNVDCNVLSLLHHQCEWIAYIQLWRQCLRALLMLMYSRCVHFLLLEYSVVSRSYRVVLYSSIINNNIRANWKQWKRDRSILGILIKWTKHADYILSKYDQIRPNGWDQSPTKITF